MRIHHCLHLLLCILTIVICGGPLAALAAEQPKIVLIVADDLGVMDIGANNPHTFYETPNIDHLASTGMRFTEGYAACPVCSPTRASIITGKYPPHTGITDYIGRHTPENWSRNTRLRPAPYRDHLELNETSLAELLKQQGYATFFAGKWHLGDEPYWPEHQGFDFNLGGIDRGGPYGGKKYFSPYGNPRLPDGPPGEHLPDRLASETVDFIRSNQDRPFFAELSFYSVHTPLMAREVLRKKYEKKRESLETSGPVWGQEREREVRLIQNHAVYAGMVEAMDQAVGKVLNAIDELGLAENTMVIFTSDNGGLSTSEGHPTSNLPYRAGKGWLYEGGIRVPTVVRVPGMTSPGSVCDVPVCSIDFFPTIAEVVGTPDGAIPEQDGASLVPLLNGGSIDRDTLYWHYPHYGNQGGAPGAAIRSGRWKLIEWFEDGSQELFDLANDPGEHSNLAEQHPKIVAKLHSQLEGWQQSLGAIMPEVNDAYDEQAMP